MLAESLEVVAPSLPRALVEPDKLPRVRDLGAALAPVPRCGFEVRLGASSRVDVQQWVTTDDGEPQRLRDHLGRLGWRRLDEFTARWSNPSSTLHREVADLWLELDQPPVRPQAQAPGRSPLPPLSVFVGFPQEPAAASGRYGVAETVLDVVLGRQAWSPWRANVERCFEACPERAFVSHVGMMLGRSAPALRINVKRLGPDRLSPYLRRVGWSNVRSRDAGEAALDEAAETMSRLHRLVDGIALGLDVGERVHSTLGFECVVAGQPPAEPRWAVLLDELVARGLCTAEKRDALLEWPGWTLPSEADAPWPAQLIRAGMLSPPDHFAGLRRELGHVKVTYRPRRPLEAKAYFGFFHAWVRTGRARDERTPAQDVADKPLPDGRRDGATHDSDESRVTAAIEEAIGFLRGARTKDGWWRDFSGAAGGPGLGLNREWISMGASDEWITTFVGAALADITDCDAHRAGREAWSVLAGRRGHADGWGWNHNVAVDADSTAFALRLAEAVGLGDSERAQGARRVLEEHLLPDGGVACYSEQAYPGYAGTAHPCVTAAAARLGDERARGFLRRAQDDDGSWTAYWWEDDEYTTAFAAEALARTSRPGDRRHVEAAIRWAAGRIGPNGAVYSAAHDGDSAFATALCVRILALAEDIGAVRDRLQPALAWLLGQQRTHGAWPPSAWMRAPRPHVSDLSDPDALLMRSLDEQGICTTATVLAALVAARSRLRELSAVRA